MMKCQSKYLRNSILNKIFVAAIINSFKYLIKHIFAKCLGIKDALWMLWGVHISLKWTENSGYQISTESSRSIQILLHFWKNLQLLLFTLGGVLKTRNALQWINPFNLAKSKEKENFKLKKRWFYIRIPMCLIRKMDQKIVREESKNHLNSLVITSK